MPPRSRKVWSRWWELVQEKLLEFAPTVGVPKKWEQSVGRWRLFPREMYTIWAIARFIKSPDCAGLLVHLVFQNSWSSGLASSEDIAVLRCFACFHIILRGDQTRTPQNKQWTTVWLAATCCSAYAGLLAQCCCLSHWAALEVANWFLSGWKKKSNNKTTNGPPLGRLREWKNPRTIQYPAEWWELCSLTVSQVFMCEDSHFLPNRIFYDFAGPWFESMPWLVDLTRFDWLRLLGFGLSKRIRSTGENSDAMNNMPRFYLWNEQRS